MSEPTSDSRSDSAELPEDDSLESFQQLIRLVRQRDEQAAAKLVRLYEPQVRRVVRVRLADPSLRKIVDSLDICQSVLANFFVRTASGEFDLERPEQLVALLVTMAQNKVHDWHRKQNAQRRDRRREVSLADPAMAQTAPQRGREADEIVAAKELLSEVEQRLPERERRLAKLRAEGRSWAEIAKIEGARPDTLRIGLQRALDRISQDLGIDG